MFEIRPTCLYTRGDLIAALAPAGIDADAWLRRIRPVKRFRLAWWGNDLIRAIEAAPLLNEPAPAPDLPLTPPSRRRASARQTAAGTSGQSVLDMVRNRQT